MRIVVLGVALLAPSAAWAYSAPARYAQDVVKGGGGGRFFTGSPSDNFTCDVCHRSGAPGPEVIINGLPDDGYVPGQTYPISFEWRAHDYGTTTEVLTIVAELQTDDGAPAGTLELPPLEDAAPDSLCVTGVPAAELFATEDGRTVVTMNPCGATRLRARWTAPAAPIDTEACAPDAVIYLAAMQGDESEDPEGDGLTLRQRRIEPEDACADAAEEHGCRFGRDASPLCLLLVLAASRCRRSKEDCHA